jgi:thermitase
MNNQFKVSLIYKLVLFALMALLVACGGSDSDEDTSLPLLDTTPPVISILGDNPASLFQGEIYADAGATASDDNDGTVSVEVSGTVDTSIVGNYIITYTAVDAAGNSVINTRTVNIVAPPDITPPVISILGDNPASLFQGEIYADAGATASDDNDGTVSVEVSGTVNTLALGTYIVGYSASDLAGNSISDTRTVEVVAPLGPFVSMQEGISSISIEEGKNALVAFVISFIDGDESGYHVTLEQSIQEDNTSVLLNSDYPIGGWFPSEDISWIVNTTLQGISAGSYTLINTVSVEETGQSFEIKVPITITKEGATGEVALSIPGADIDALNLNQTENVIFTAKVSGSTQPPQSVNLEQTNADGSSMLGELGVLLDDGILNDQLMSDLVYTGSFDISGTTEGAIYFRASVSMGAENFVSDIYSIEITRFPTDISPSNSSSLITDGKGEQVYTDEILVSFVDGTSPDRIEEIVSAEGGNIRGTILSLGVFQIGFSSNNSLSSLQVAIQSFEAYPEVKYAEANYFEEESSFTPNDTSFSSQNNMSIIRAEEAWAVAKGDILIAVIDTGVDYENSDLSGKVIKGKDYVDNDDDPMDEKGHGTHVAGIAAASSNNSSDVAGVAWGSKILAVRAIGGGGHKAFAAAVRYATDKGAKIINYSGGGTDSKTKKGAVEYAVKKGVLFVSTAGNNGKNEKRYPCSYDGVFCVGNSTDSDGRAPLSNYGVWVDIAAPGESVLSTKLGGGTTTLSGTSMSAPLVAGAAAVVWSMHPEWTASQVQERLVKSGKSIDLTLLIGSTRLDLFEAVFNGSFELGDLSEWVALGTASSVTELGSGADKLTPYSGKRMALLSTGPAGDQTETTLNKNFTIQEGVNSLNIKFDYNFISDEYPEFVGSSYDDTLLIQLTLPNGSTVELAKETINDSVFTDISGLSLPGGDETVGQTRRKTVDVEIPVEAGVGEYSISISDLGDDVYDSIILIDSIRLK